MKKFWLRCYLYVQFDFFRLFFAFQMFSDQGPMITENPSGQCESGVTIAVGFRSDGAGSYFSIS